MSMQAVSLAGSQRDALLLSFRDAKLSLVEYDLDTHDLKTLSLHYFEEEEIRVNNLIFKLYVDYHICTDFLVTVWTCLNIRFHILNMLH